MFKYKPCPQQEKYLMTIDRDKLALFVDQFRNAAPYINNFRNKIFVVYFSGDILQSEKLFSLIQDLHLLHSLGIRLVVIHGSRPQIDRRLQQDGVQSTFHDDMRITDNRVLQIAKEVCGSIRFELEALFSRISKFHPHMQSSINGQAFQENSVSICSGNYITAQPIGIIDGIDFQHTGKVRKVHSNEILPHLKGQHIVLISPLGNSPTGEIFNLNAEELAISCAQALDADKLVYLSDIKGFVDNHGHLLEELTLEQARQLLQLPNNYSDRQKHCYQRLIHACEEGLSRIHIISQDIDGAILLELFTSHGHGTLISRDSLEQICQATIDDVSGIIELLEPLEDKHIIVKRSRDILEMEIENFMLIKREDKVIACAALYPFEDQQSGELACLAVDAEYRKAGRGNKLFQHICQKAKALGLKQIYALTTQTAHWFVERGFQQASISDLPIDRQHSYNYQRNSAVYIKKL